MRSFVDVYVAQKLKTLRPTMTYSFDDLKAALPADCDENPNARLETTGAYSATVIGAPALRRLAPRRRCKRMGLVAAAQMTATTTIFVAAWISDEACQT